MSDIPVTMAIRFLRQHNVEPEPHLYRWEKKGANASAEALGVDVAEVIKTLIFETDTTMPLMVLMDGTHEVSAKTLARHLGVKSVAPCTPKRAETLTGYQVGGISPFGTKTKMKVYMQETLLLLDKAYINGGKRGFLIRLPTDVIQRLLNAECVDVAAPE
ncbi:MAG: aminoacyl-tRNA deacylase [Myxococcales bacterium]|nr:aminoacyl-tRNA deacylase [Myxococcales bacterium]